MRSGRQQPPCSGRASDLRGFTLIEMLVSITLLAMIGLAIAQGVRFAQRSLQAADRFERAGLELLAAQNFLRHTLESTSPSGSGAGPLDSTRALRGSGHEIEFRAQGPLSFADGAESVFAIRLSQQRLDSRKQDLIVTWHPRADDSSGTGELPEVSEALITDVAEVRWSYLAATSTSTFTPTLPGWTDEWQGRSDLPVLIRLEVKFKQGDRRTWPPFVVQLRLTHDSGCVFDVVAQDCRRT